jgi:hypothetical protein
MKKFCIIGNRSPFTEAADEQVQTNENLLTNGDFRITQEGTVFDNTTTPPNDNDTYLFDQMNLLSDGNNRVEVSQSADVPEGAGCAYSCKFVAVSDHKFSYFQPIKSEDAIKVDEKTMSFPFWAKTTSGKLINNVRAAIVSWDGVADSITSDIIASWNLNGTNPTLAANWTYENTPVDIAIDTEWTQYFIEADIDTANMTNVGVFLWVDESVSALDELFITGLDLYEGSGVRPFPFRSELYEFFKSLYYFFPRYQSENTFVGNPSLGQCISGTNAIMPVEFPVPMRIIPSTSNSGAGDLAITNAAALLQNLTALGVLSAGLHNSVYSYIHQATVAAGLVAGNSTMMVFNSANPNGFIKYDARL